MPNLENDLFTLTLSGCLYLEYFRYCLVLNCEVHKKVFIYVYLQFKRKLFDFDITENPFKEAYHHVYMYILLSKQAPAHPNKTILICNRLSLIHILPRIAGNGKTRLDTFYELLVLNINKSVDSVGVFDKFIVIITYLFRKYVRFPSWRL